MSELSDKERIEQLEKVIELLLIDLTSRLGLNLYASEEYYKEVRAVCKVFNVTCWENQ